MTTYDAIEQFATALPETVVSPSYRGSPTVKVNKKIVFRHAEEHDDRIDPATGKRNGEVMMLRVPHLGDKEALLQSEPAKFFTTAHYDGYPAVLVRLALLSFDEAQDLVLESWYALAPQRAIKAYEAT